MVISAKSHTLSLLGVLFRMAMIERPQFNLMKSFWDAGKTLPDEMRLKYYDALLQYGFTQTLPEDICAVANALLVSNKPILDISWTRYLAKAGKTKQDQTEIKSKSNQNQNQIKQDQIEKNEGKEEGERKKEKGERKMEVDTTPLNPLKGKRIRKKTALPTIPSELNQPVFTTAWQEWIQHRSELKKRLTPSTATKQLQMLLPMGADHAAAVLNHSITKGWQGLFPDDVPAPVTPTQPEPQYFEPANRSEILKVFPNRTDLVDTPWSELTPDVQQVITEKCKEL